MYKPTCVVIKANDIYFIGKDKRFLYPHGITKPLKNVRKKRFRKMLRKKYVDFPEIEKEVKRLLRTDNEAKSVRYEIVNAEDEKNDNKDMNMASSSGAMNSEYDVGMSERTLLYIFKRYLIIITSRRSLW